jgi:hypothetical protein
METLFRNCCIAECWRSCQVVRPIISDISSSNLSLATWAREYRLRTTPIAVGRVVVLSSPETRVYNVPIAADLRAVS